MIRIAILEDEPAALNRLKRLLKIVRPNYEIVGDADSVADGIKLLSNSKPELIFSDIQLADGLSFEVIRKSKTNALIIFVTAYDKYAIEAFDFNGIYYVLKPITEASLNNAIQKFEMNPLYLNASDKIVQLIENEEFSARKRIISKIGNKTKIIEIENIAFVYSENKINKVVTFDNQRYFVDYSLDELLKDMPDDKFFKISRQFIVNTSAVIEWKSYSSGRLELKTNPAINFEIIVSKDKTPRFKAWMNRE